MSMRNDPSAFRSISFSRISGAYRGYPYGANPINLYSPEFTLNPVKYVNAEYNNPSECGKRSSCDSRIRFPAPLPKLVVAHSPTPSIVKIAACSNGDGKN